MGLNSRESDRSGEWIPTIVGVANFTSATLIGAIYSVTGNVVSCAVSIALVSDAGVVEWTISLPPDFSRIFAGAGNASGVIGSATVGVGIVAATPDADTVTCITAQGAVTEDNGITFSYILD
jgi:hypothetical protein